MPMVNGKHYPYTKAGKQAAKRAMAKMMPKRRSKLKTGFRKI